MGEERTSLELFSQRLLLLLLQRLPLLLLGFGALPLVSFALANRL